MSFLRSTAGPPLIALGVALAAPFAIQHAGEAGWSGYEDGDGDGVNFFVDNCMYVYNPTQADSDGDGFGNVCDADFDNNRGAGISDYTLFQNEFGGAAPTYNELIDMDCNGGVGISDYTLFKNNFGGNYVPGTQTYSGLTCVGTPPCPAGAHPCP